jgi:hypothetical protein
VYQPLEDKYRRGEGEEEQNPQPQPLHFSKIDHSLASSLRLAGLANAGGKIAGDTPASTA